MELVGIDWGSRDNRWNAHETERRPRDGTGKKLGNSTDGLEDRFPPCDGLSYAGDNDDEVIVAGRYWGILFRRQNDWF